MNIKGIISYIFIVGIAVLFTLFLDATSGSYLLAVLIFAPVLSALSVIISSRSIEFDAELNQEVVNKRDKVTLSISAKKRSFLPSSVIGIKVSGSQHLLPISTGANQKLCFVLGVGNSVKRIGFDFTAVFFGYGELNIEQIELRDYLGLFIIRKKANISKKSVRIYPDICDINPHNALSRTIEEANVYDDSEETVKSGFTASGVPGYEHRDYVPGDSLKQVNWKLSAKRDKLLVRMSESLSGSVQAFILDTRAAQGNDLAVQQSVVEGLLSLFNMLVRMQLPCRLLIYMNDCWNDISFENIGDISELRYSLTGLKFYIGGVTRLPDFANERPGELVLFTASPDNELLALTSQQLSKGFTFRIVTSAACSDDSDKLWQIRDNEGELDYVQGGDAI